jgi:hypothetical protein
MLTSSVATALAVYQQSKVWKVMNEVFLRKLMGRKPGSII